MITRRSMKGRLILLKQITLINIRHELSSVKQGTNPDFSEDIFTPANGKTIKEIMLLEMRASRYICQNNGASFDL